MANANMTQAISSIVNGVSAQDSDGSYNGNRYISLKVNGHDFNFYKAEVQVNQKERTVALKGYLDHAYRAWPDDAVSYVVITDGVEAKIAEYSMKSGNTGIIEGAAAYFNIDAKPFVALHDRAKSSNWEGVVSDVLERAALQAHRKYFK